MSSKRVLIKPLITEKLTQLSEGLRTYGFQVDPKANKIEIKQAIEKMYGVQVEEVRTMNSIGKYGWQRTPFGISKGSKGQMKKAYVTLKEGEEIDFFSNV
ncbi:MAG: 50S ribosomal protein L23 [Chitinophagales bacterium]|nr:50S ribosomal protein L23 [Chitinophagales bacterium]HPR29002.1 50S ribosomal protein L23 [Chitinophagales bacterium]HQU39981.1 50S ribosomal protein L23 [Chitinophagales bacterium]HRX22933.1 50S ribosomal protein L23 [Chitinophagales bacterium]